MSLGETIRKRRIELGLSQQDLADVLGYKTRSSIAKLEKYSSKLSQDRLLTLANTLNTTVDFLLTGEPLSSNVTYHGKIISENEFIPQELSKPKKRKCAAVILAGGKYRVNKHHIPYQFVSVDEKPIIIYTLEAYQRHPMIDEIYVVCLAGWEDFLPPYAEKYSISKLKGVVPAGEKGILSVKNAIEWLTPTYSAPDVIILQEATRPLIDPEAISNAIQICKTYGSAISYTHLENTTPFILDKDKNTVASVDANRLISIQSPEVYTLGTLKLAFNEAVRLGHNFTETICSVFMHNLGKELYFCEGAHSNLRIVSEEDLYLFKMLK